MLAMSRTKLVSTSAIEEHKETIVDTIKRNQSDGKHLKDVAEKSYFNFLMSQVFAEITTDPNLMNDVLERVKTKMTMNDNEAFNLRIVKLVKAELVEMFKEEIGGIMGKKKVVLDSYFPNKEASTTDDDEDEEEE
jgi:aspartyl/asparaginyl beta-hydroxylase (cupin superfamily)